MQQAYTWDEIHNALSYLNARKGAPGGARWPSVLPTHLEKQRRADKMADKADRKPAQHVHRQNSERCTDRKALADAINAHLGGGLYVRWCQPEDYLDAMMGRSVDEIVSMYAQVVSQPRELDDPAPWKLTAQAFAAGEKPVRLGQLPPANDEGDVADIIAGMKKALGINVQTNSVDKSAQAS